MSEPSEQKARQVLGLDDFTEEDIAALETQALRAALIKGEESGLSSRNVHDIWTAVQDEPRDTTPVVIP